MNMLLIKNLEWYSVGQEAIVYTNNDVNNITGTAFHIEVLKCTITRLMMTTLIYGIYLIFFSYALSGFND